MMTRTEIREGFNQMIAAARAAGDDAAADRMEIAREYLTNGEFKTGLESFMFELTR